MTEKLLFDVHEAVATITLNNPEKLNAFDPDMLDGYFARLEECRTREDINVIILTGSGRGFCSGGDTGGMGRGSQPSAKHAKDNLQNMIQRIPLKLMEIDKPVLAGVNGVAVGAGMDLALQCDLRYAAESARFAETYVRMGLVPGNGAAWFLPRIVGVPKALEMLWTADFVNAAQAKELGIVQDVFPDEGFIGKVQEVGARIAGQAPISVRYIKRLVQQGQTMDLRTHLDLVSSHMVIARTSEDHAEAIDAYRAKRTPKFKGS